MKKLLLFIVFMYSATCVVQAQTKIGFSKSSQKIVLKENYIDLAIQVTSKEVKDSNKPFFINIDLAISGDTKDSKRIMIKRVSKEIVINSKENNVEVRFPINKDSIKNNDVLNFKFALAKADKNITLTQTTHDVFVTDSKDENAYQKINERKYNLHIGTNFDLKDRFEANSFYSEIDVFLPNLVCKKWGLRGGIYKNNSVSTLEEQERDLLLTEIQENSITNDSLTIVTSQVSSTPTVSYENLGFYAGILFTIKKHKEKHSSFEIFASLNFELIQRKEKYTYEDKLIFPLENSRISLDSLANNSMLQRTLSSNRTGTRTRKYFSSYIGIGFPMLYNNKHIQVMLNPTFGAGHPGFSINGNDSSKIFGSIQFSLMEKKFGIKLSGDIRRYWGFGQDPIITLNLSKSFDLTSIFESNQQGK